MYATPLKLLKLLAPNVQDMFIGVISQHVMPNKNDPDLDPDFVATISFKWDFVYFQLVYATPSKLLEILIPDFQDMFIVAVSQRVMKKKIDPDLDFDFLDTFSLYIF